MKRLSLVGCCINMVMVLFIVSFFCPLVAWGQDGQATALKATVPAPIVGQATLSGQKPVLSEDQLEQLRRCIDRTHLYPWERARTERGVSIGSSSVVGDPSVVVEDREDRERGDPADFDFRDMEEVSPSEAVPYTSDVFNFRIIHELSPSEAGPYTSDVMEPSTAFNNRHGIITGNWFAAHSRTETSFKYINPWSDWPLYPARTGYSYCCDQEVVFDPVTQCFFWSILYYSPSNTGGYLRIAVSKDPNSGIWWAYDFNFEWDGADDTTLPDYPHIALSRNYLYVTYNEFQDNYFNQTVLLRLPTLPMSMAKSMVYWHYETSEVFGLKVASDYQHQSTMYAVSNYAPNFPSIRVYEWKEGSSTIYWHDITGLNWWAWQNYQCIDPGNHNPCGRLDDRITGAVASYNRQFPEDCKNQLWVAWTAAQDSNFQYPYIYVVKVSLDDWTIIGYSHIHNSAFAFAYPAMAANGRGDIGVTGDVLGGYYYNMFWVLPIDMYTGYNPGFTIYAVAVGNDGPPYDEWGDYNGVNAWYPNMYQWVGSGHVRYQDSGPTAYYVRFSREGDNDPGILPCECDLNGDGRCDMSDWLLFGEDWGRYDCPVTNDQ